MVTGSGSACFWSRRQVLAVGATWLTGASLERNAVSAARAHSSRTPSTRAAAIFDIHGNLPALEAVLDDIHKAAVDEIIVGGDIFPGPMPMDVLSRLDAVNVPIRYIKGNGDRIVLAARSGDSISEVPPPYQDVVRWGAQLLSDVQAQRIDAWPPTLSTEVTGHGSVLCCHATPRNDREIFTRQTLESRLLPVFEGIEVPLVVCGHTHMQFDRRVGKLRVVNAGSVGMPFGEPGAYWLLLGPKVELRRTTYDLSRAAERIRRTAYPQAAEFAEGSVLKPPSEAQMLAAYSRVELR